MVIVVGKVIINAVLFKHIFAKLNFKIHFYTLPVYCTCILYNLALDFDFQMESMMVCLSLSDTLKGVYSNHYWHCNMYFRSYDCLIG